MMAEQSHSHRVRTDSAFILMNNGSGVLYNQRTGADVLDANGNQRIRDGFTIFVHEMAHVGQPTTQNHDAGFTQRVFNLLSPFGLQG
jgi:hypothetical protein